MDDKLEILYEDESFFYVKDAIIILKHEFSGNKNHMGRQYKISYGAGFIICHIILFINLKK